jgi:hypothetical protein
VQKINFVGVVVFEKRFEAIVEGNTYAYDRPWHKESLRTEEGILLSLKVCLQ